MDGTLRQASKEFLVRYGGDTFPNLFRSRQGHASSSTTPAARSSISPPARCAPPSATTIRPSSRGAIEAGEKAFHMFSGMIPEVVAELAADAGARLDARRRSSASIFVNTGSESNEVALRMAKMYTGGYEILALGGSWHGVTGGTSAVSFASDRKGYGVPCPASTSCPSRTPTGPTSGPVGRRGGARLPGARPEDVRHGVDRPRAPRSSSSRSSAPAACWCRRSRSCRRCARPPTSAACC